MPKPKDSYNVLQCLRLLQYLSRSGAVHRDQVMKDMNLSANQLKVLLDTLRFEVEKGENEGYFGSVHITGGMTEDDYDEGDEVGILLLEGRPGDDLDLLGLFNLSEEEIRTLAISLMSLIHSDSLNDEWTAIARNTFNKLVTFFGMRIPEVITPGDEDARESREQDILETLTEAIQHHRVTHLRYQNAAGIVSERDVEPLLVHDRLGYWILGAYCRLREDYREFEVTNILDLQVSDKETFEPIDPKPLRNTELVEVEISKAGQFLIEELPAIEKKNLGEDVATVTIPLYGTEWFWRTLLEIAPYVKGVTPVSQAAPAIEEAKRALELYKS